MFRAWQYGGGVCEVMTDKIEGLLDGINTYDSKECNLFIADGEVYIVNEWGEILFCDYLH